MTPLVIVVFVVAGLAFEVAEKNGFRGAGEASRFLAWLFFLAAAIHWLGWE